MAAATTVAIELVTLFKPKYFRTRFSQIAPISLFLSAAAAAARHSPPPRFHAVPFARVLTVIIIIRHLRRLITDHYIFHAHRDMQALFSFSWARTQRICALALAGENDLLNAL